MDAEDGDLVSMAQNGEMDYSKWPALLERMIPRLEHVVYHDFPTVSIPLPSSSPRGLKREGDPASGRDSVERDEPPEKKIKRNSAEEDEAAVQEDVPSGHQTGRSPHPTGAIDSPQGSLHPLLSTLLHTIIDTLRTSFPDSPPHTSQRLAELVLSPHKHYQTLPSYLRALDRIVSVASPASIFPLKSLNVSSTGSNGAMLNGIPSPMPEPLEDEDFIGGAELTEIPWAPRPQPMDSDGEGTHTTTNGLPSNASDLRTESTSLIDGPNGLGGVETVTVTNGGSGSTIASNDNSQAGSPDVAAGEATSEHGVTQGEVLRQEQEAGIVPVPLTAHSSQGGASSSRVTRSSAAASAAASRSKGTSELEMGEDTPAAEDFTPEEETVHARGPGVIGMEDMGPQAPGSGLQGGIDVEGALGRRGEIVMPPDDMDGRPERRGETHELDGMDLRKEVAVTETGEGEDPDISSKDDGRPEEGEAMVTEADGVPGIEKAPAAAEEKEVVE